MHSRPSALLAKTRTLFATPTIRLRAVWTIAAIGLRCRSDRTFTAHLAIGPRLLRRWAIGACGAVCASLLGRAIGALRLRTTAIGTPHSLAAAPELPGAWTAFAVLWSGIRVVRAFGLVGIGTARAFLTLRRAWRALGRIVLGAERPRGKREGGCGH